MPLFIFYVILCRRFVYCKVEQLKVQKMTQLNQEVLNELKTNEDLQYAIAKGMHRKMRTIREWIKDIEKPDPILSSQAVVLIIQKFTGKTEDEIVVHELQSENATA